jgi:Lar family restriction alleviation protein
MKGNDGSYILKPCPFCGNDRIEMVPRDFVNGFWARLRFVKLKCKQCKIETEEYENTGLLIDFWNKRV